MSKRLSESLQDRIEQLELALRRLSALGDTLSPQEIINNVARALGVDTYLYSGSGDGSKSNVELVRMLSEARLAGVRAGLEAAAQVADVADVQCRQPHMEQQGYRPLGIGGDIRALSPEAIAKEVGK